MTVNHGEVATERAVGTSSSPSALPWFTGFLLHATQNEIEDFCASASEEVLLSIQAQHEEPQKKQVERLAFFVFVSAGHNIITSVASTSFQATPEHHSACGHKMMLHLRCK